LSDDTITANDLSSTLDSDQDSIFEMVKSASEIFIIFGLFIFNAFLMLHFYVTNGCRKFNILRKEVNASTVYLRRE
jgi:hypothetical protein